MKLPSVLGLRTTAILSGVSLLAGLGGGWVLHDRLVYKPHLLKDSRVEAKIKDVTSDASQTGQTMGQTVRDDTDKKTQQVRTITRTITKEIPVYVPTTPASEPRTTGNDVTVGFGLLHDYAATGTTPPATAPSSGDLARPSGIGMSAVADTLSYNYGLCHEWKTERDQWRVWYPKLQQWWADTDRKLSKASR